MQYEKIPNKINRGISIVIFGEVGSGKTTAAATLPEKETLIITAECGLGPLLGTGHVVFDVLKAIKNYEIEKVIDGVYKFLRTEKHPFKNIVIDNLSELEQQLILNLTKARNKNSPEIREYGDSSYKLKEWVHLFRDLIYQDINIIFNAWEFPLEIRSADGIIITKTFPLIGKKIAPQICGIVDVVGHMEVNEKTQQRRIRFAPCDQYITKSQFQGLGAAEPADLPLIFDKLRSYDYGTVS